MLGEAAQDYLKAIWKLGQGGRATTSALADELGVSPGVRDGDAASASRASASSSTSATTARR